MFRIVLFKKFLFHSSHLHTTAPPKPHPCSKTPPSGTQVPPLHTRHQKSSTKTPILAAA